MFFRGELAVVLTETLFFDSKERKASMQRKDGFVVRIKLKDENGKVVGEVDAISYKGLLSLAHEEGLRSVRTELTQVPGEENRRTAVVRAVVRTRRGRFTGIGDANPANVNRRIAPHVIRMAETRAVARALRVAVNIGEVAIEELCDDFSIETAPKDESREEPRRQSESREEERAPQRPEPFRGRDDHPTDAEPNDRRAMSEMQRKYLFRLAFDLGESRETARDRVLKALGVDRFEHATRVDASRAIEALTREGNGRKGNGKGNGAEAHHAS